LLVRYVYLICYAKTFGNNINAWNITSSEINTERVFCVRLLKFFIYFIRMPHLLMGKTHTDAEGEKTNGLTRTRVAPLTQHLSYTQNFETGFWLITFSFSAYSDILCTTVTSEYVPDYLSTLIKAPVSSVRPLQKAS
jgi:hypothetical protein